MTSDVAAAAAVIHDVRYSRFSGELHSRLVSVLALAQSSGQRSLGIRRSGGAKVWPFILVAAAFLPAIIAVGVPLIVKTVASPLDVLTPGQLLLSTAVVQLAYAATTLPSLLTRERRDRVLTLYFSTAVSPSEYVAGKVLAAVSLMLLITLGPLLLTLVGGILVADHPARWAQAHAGLFPKVVLATLIVAVYQAAIGLALGALTSRRVFAVGGYVALMLVPAGMGAAFTGVTGNNNYLGLDLLRVPLTLGSQILSSSDTIGEQAPLPMLWVEWGCVLLIGALVLARRYASGRES